ncbi:transposon Tf2-9 polyprotein [Trichonephila clavipes]|nr:transposon Tf2-9 polyprotein [Trichonephila clavipes]
MNDVGAVKIPAYNFHDPALWFTMCDSTFQLGCPKAITDSKTKFNYIIAHLPPEAATIIRDVIMNPDPVEPYEKARTELIKRSGESSHQEIRKLLIGEELGDRPASAHSCTIHSCSYKPADTGESCRSSRSSHGGDSIAVSACSVSSDKNSIESHVLEEIKKLNLRIDEISRSRSRSRNRNLPFHKRNRSKSKTYEQCWYHYKFGSAAQKCHPPCKFSKTSPVRYNGDYCLAKKFSSPFIRDRRTNVTFLIDTGSDVSIIPATKTQRQNNSQMTLSAANTSPIHVYTTQTLSLDLGLRRIFQWTFLVGNVSTPIIGADFLYNFRLVPDISNSRIHSIKTVSGDSVYHELLRKFPDITKPPRPDQEIKHSVVHYIETNSRPVSAKARRLAPDRLRIAKRNLRT